MQCALVLIDWRQINVDEEIRFPNEFLEDTIEDHIWLSPDKGNQRNNYFWKSVEDAYSDIYESDYVKEFSNNHKYKLQFIVGEISNEDIINYLSKTSIFYFKVIEVLKFSDFEFKNGLSVRIQKNRNNYSELKSKLSALIYSRNILQTEIEQKTLNNEMHLSTLNKKLEQLTNEVETLKSELISSRINYLDTVLTSSADILGEVKLITKLE